MALIHVEHLTKAYPGRNGGVKAIDGVSLDVDGGDFVAVRGPSGCGKTTLLLTLGGLLQPTDGVVEVDGTAPYRLRPEARARFRATHVGFVFQQFHLVPSLSVAENVLAPALAAPGPDARDRADELIDRFGLAHRADHRPSELSTGERQRTALARALLNRPKVLLADEPTGNLDPDNADVVLGHLEVFAAAGGAVVLVTHEDHAADRAGRVLHMRAGRLEH